MAGQNHTDEITASDNEASMLNELVERQLNDTFGGGYVEFIPWHYKDGGVEPTKPPVGG